MSLQRLTHERTLLNSSKCSQNSPTKTVRRVSGHQTYPDDEDPLDEGKAEAADGAVASGDGVGQAEGQTETDPVEEEGHWRERRPTLTQPPQKPSYGRRRLTEEGQHEDSVVADSELVGVAEVVSGDELVILAMIRQK